MYRKRIRDGARKLKPAYAIVTLVCPGGIFAVASVNDVSTSSTNKRSIATGGATGFFRMCDGSTMATPLEVANHSSPPLVFDAAGCPLAERSSLGSPSG